MDRQDLSDAGSQLFAILSQIILMTKPPFFVPKTFMNTDYVYLMLGIQRCMRESQL